MKQITKTELFQQLADNNEKTASLQEQITRLKEKKDFLPTARGDIRELRHQLSYLQLDRKRINEALQGCK